MSSNEKQEFVEEAESLTIHGIARVVKAKTKWGKIIWLVLWITALSILIRFSIELIIKHFQKNVFEEVTKNADYIDTLPALTFCNKNIDSYGIPYPVYQDLPADCSMIDDKYFANKKNQAYFIAACRMFLSGYAYGSAQINTLDQAGIETIRFPRNYSILPHFWLCFTLNRNALISQLFSGEENGLNMILYFDDMVHTDIGPVNLVSEHRQGLIVTAHDPKVHVPDFGGIFLSPGYHTRIKIKKIVKHRKPAPFTSKCKNPDEPSKIFPGRNTNARCYYGCYLYKLYHQCDGVPEHFRSFMSFKDYPKNISYQYYTKCTKKVEKELKLSDCDCRLPCYEETYLLESTSTRWPQSWQAPMLASLLAAGSGLNYQYSNTTIDDVRKKLIKVTFYYDDLITEVRREKELYSFSSIVSDMGGQMGLFLGASILSLVEIAALLINAIKCLYNKNKIKKFNPSEG